MQPPVGDDFHLLSRQSSNAYLGSKSLLPYNSSKAESTLVGSGVEPWDLQERKCYSALSSSCKSAYGIPPLDLKQNTYADIYRDSSFIDEYQLLYAGCLG